MNKELTGKQRETLNYIINVFKTKGHSPTIAEIGDNFNIAVRAAWDRVQALNRKGYISINSDHGRNIRLIGYKITLEKE